MSHTLSCSHDDDQPTTTTTSTTSKTTATTMSVTTGDGCALLSLPLPSAAFVRSCCCSSACSMSLSFWNRYFELGPSVMIDVAARPHCRRPLQGVAWVGGVKHISDSAVAQSPCLGRCCTSSTNMSVAPPFVAHPWWPPEREKAELAAWWTKLSLLDRYDQWDLRSRQAQVGS